MSKEDTMNENPYTETVTAEELSGEHIGLAARAITYDAADHKVTTEGTVTGITVNLTKAVAPNRAREDKPLTVEVNIGGRPYPLPLVRFHHDAAAIRTRRAGALQGEDREAYLQKLRDAGHIPDDTVTIPRDVYDVLVAEHKTYERIASALGPIGHTPRLTARQVAELYRF